MSKLNLIQSRDLLQAFDFTNLFVEQLGWSHAASPKPKTLNVAELEVSQKQIAQLGGVVVFEITTNAGTIPTAKQQALIHREISKTHYENVLIFLDEARTQSLWYWVKRDGKKSYSRPHEFLRGQPGDLFLSKIASMVVDLGELDQHGNIAVTEVANRVREALDVERVTRKFYEDYKSEHVRFVEFIEGINDERDRQWYASVLLNRLMFIYFLQRKFFIDKGDGEYLQRRLQGSEAVNDYWYYGTFLRTLFFEGFGKPELNRSPAAKKLLGEIKFLDGGLFLPHKIEEKYGDQIRIKNVAFLNILNLFKRYSWNLNDTPGEDDNEIRPDVLGYIFEKYINQKAFGAYYTRTEITEYLCEQTIDKLILEKVNELLTTPGPGARISAKYETIAELLLNLDSFLCRQLLIDILPSLSILDPACGSGAFLVAALKTLIKTYSAVIGRIEFLNDRYLNKWLSDARREHPSVSYFIKKRIITDNLFGVDIMEEASEIAKLRLFLTLVASAETVDQLEPLPNIDFNLLTGNSLIGLMHVDDKEFDKRHAQENLFRKRYGELLSETKRKIALYRRNVAYSESLVDLRDEIDTLKKETVLTLDEILLSEFQKLGIKFDQATWDETKNKEGRSIKRALKLSDITALKPFHWGFEFDEVINHRGGFDVIITNPPWEVFKPIAKEFCYEVDPTIERRGTNIKDFEKRLGQLLQTPKLRKRYLDYASQFPHLSAYFRSVRQYANQMAIVNGKKAGTDINLYKLFLEQCLNLLRKGGECGIVLPSGIYSDLGTKQLRETLFTQTTITGLFCLENRHEIFEGVHRSYKFVILSFEKGGSTEEFPAAFMRHDVQALAGFPTQDGLRVKVELIRKLSPDSLSIIEFQDEQDIDIVQKMAPFPLLGNKIDGRWNLSFTRELDMTNDSGLFEQEPATGRLPLYEGKMIWHYESWLVQPRYWVSEKRARAKLLSPRVKTIKKLLAEAKIVSPLDESEIQLGYEDFRLGFRAVTGATNERSLVVSLIPQSVFCGNSLIVSVPFADKIINGEWKQVKLYSSQELLASTSLIASFVCDWFIRKKILTNMNMFYVYEIPVPRLTEVDTDFGAIVERAAKLICTTPDFDVLARKVGLRDHKEGVTEPTARARLRAELDAIIAHLYGLTEEEFIHILSSFSLVEQSVKDGALDAFREFAPKPVDQEIAALIARGESNTLEFKSSARWDIKQNKADKLIEGIVVKAVAALLNSEGGALLLGVDDDKNVIGLAHDYKLFGKKDSRDAYENFLMTLLLNNLGKDSAALISITFHEVREKDVCRVEVKKSPKPIFVKDNNGEHLYIRAGNSTRMLSTREAMEYFKMRWSS